MKNNFLTSAFLWPLLTLICVILILSGLNAAIKKTGWNKTTSRKILIGTALLILLWSALLIVLSYKGFFAEFSKLPPRPVLAILMPLPFVLIIAFSKSGTKLLRSVPPQWLVWMQSFRIVVEGLIWSAFVAGMLPVQMTFEGKNLDVISGVIAVPVGWLLSRKKEYALKLAVAFNVMGLLLLLNILGIAVLSMPTSIRYFMNEPSSFLVAQFPFILLPGVLVPIAYSLHIFSLRQLFITKTHSPESLEFKTKDLLKNKSNTRSIPYLRNFDHSSKKSKV